MPPDGVEIRKRELLASDLPNVGEVPLRVAACWLCGLEEGSLDNFEQAGPSQRTKATIGRTHRSARLWLVVLQHLQQAQDDPELAFPWQEFVEVARLEGPPLGPLREKAAARLIAAAATYCDERGLSVQGTIERWEPVLKSEWARESAIRNATLYIAQNLQSLLPSERLGPDIVDALRAVGESKLGIRLSLLSNSLDSIEDPRRGGVCGVELWTAIRAEKRKTLLKDVTLNRQQLIHLFVTLPDSKRDNWITETSSSIYWPVALALGYMKFEGDMERLYQRADLLAKVGYDDFEMLVTPQLISESPESDASSEAKQLEGFLRQGNVTALAMRNEGPALEKISPAEWHYLEFRSEFHPQHIYAIDRTRRSRTRLNHVMVCRTQLKALIKPKLPKRGTIIGDSQGVSRMVPVDSVEKVFLWKLVDYLKAHAQSPRGEEGTKKRVLERLDDENQLTPTKREDLWNAARWLVPENAQAKWSGPGRRKSKPSKTSQKIAPS